MVINLNYSKIRAESFKLDKFNIIETIYTSDFVFVFYILDWDHDDWNDHFAVDEFLQDVTTVERDNKKIQIDWKPDR